MFPILLATAFAAVPELDISAGYLAGGSNDPRALLASLRAGVDLDDRMTLSAVLIGVPGPAAQYASGSQAGRVDPSGMQAWASLVELRVHTSGPLQLHLAAAAGIGQLLNWQCSDTVNCTENDILHGHPSLALQGSGGIRFLPAAFRGFSLGGQLAFTDWYGQDDVANLAAHPSWQSRAAPRLTWALLGGVGYRWR